MCSGPSFKPSNKQVFIIKLSLIIILLPSFNNDIMTININKHISDDPVCYIELNSLVFTTVLFFDIFFPASFLLVCINILKSRAASNHVNV